MDNPQTISPQKMMSSGSVVFRCLKRARGFAGLLVPAVILMLVVGGMTAIVPFLLRDLVDRAFVGGERDIMGLYLLALIGLMVARQGVVFGQAGMVSLVQTRMLKSMQVNLFRRLARQPYKFFAWSNSGTLVSSVMADSLAAVSIVYVFISEVVKRPITAIFLVSSLFVMDWRLAVFSLCLIPLVGLCMLLARRYVGVNSAAMVEDRARLFGAAQETFEGIKTVKAYSLEDRAAESFAARAGSYYRRVFRNIVAQAAVNPLPELLGLAGFVAGLFLLEAEIDSGAITTGEIVAFLGVLLALYASIGGVASSVIRIESLSPAAGRVLGFLELPEEEGTGDERPRFEDPIEEVRFEGVTFAYSGREPVLENFSLTLKKGEFTTISGPSGAGKTTIADLLLGLIRPSSGTIYINGQNAGGFGAESLRRRMGVVTQTPFLFEGTIGENIRVGDEGADEGKVLEAARLAGLEGYIESLPRGLDSRVGDRGAMVSGGEAQRIALARALVRDADMLVLDEATSALDAKTEAGVLETLKSLAAERIVLFISHREAVERASDRVIEL